MKKSLLLLLGIFLLALFLRFFNLSAIPNSLHQDELNAGYQGYKLIKTGTDLYGNFLPLYIDRFGDFRPAGIFYITGLITALFGLTTFWIRFAAAFIGALTIFPVFYLTNFISKKKSIGLLAGLLLAISPWHIVASRATSEQVVALFLIIVGIIFLLKSFEKKRIPYLIISMILLLLSYFFYHTPRVFIPSVLTLFSALLLFYPSTLGLSQKITQKKIYVGLAILIVGITACITFTSFGIGRFNQTSIFSSRDIQAKIKSLSDTDKNVTTARIFHNKVVVYGKTFIDQYLSYFSTQFLYVSGGLPDRYVVPDMGLFYYIEFPLLLIGFYFFIKRKDPFFVIILLWILCGPLAAAVTTEDIPNIQRAIFMLPTFQIIEAYGLYFLLQNIKGKTKGLLGIFIFLAFALQMIYFWHQYMVHSPSHIAYRRDDGNSALFASLFKQEKDVDVIYVPTFEDLPLYYYYFLPDKSHLVQIKKEEISKGLTTGKYHFVSEECPEKLLSPADLKSERILIVDNATCSTNDVSSSNLQRIIRQDYTTAYLIKRVGKQ